MPKEWTAKAVLETARSFQPAAVLAAAAELGVFDALADGPLDVEALARRIEGDVRATTILADALAALELVTKRDGRYANAAGVADVLTEGGAHRGSAIVRHLANCLRGWAQLAGVVRRGAPAERGPSVRGEAGDLESFIEAMDDVSRGPAEKLVPEIGPPPFTHLLDVGGGPATWTILFLQARPEAAATLFDRPDVLPIAERHIAAAGMSDRVTLVGGDFAADPLPGGADLAWVSGIVHQNSRRENRDLFAKVRAALTDGGRILIRDVVMDENHVSPSGGALFAVNMLVHTPLGGTFTFEELAEDLAASGFDKAKLIRRDEFTGSVVEATKA